MLSRRAAASATATLSRTLSLLNPAKHTTARFSTTSPTNPPYHQPPPWLMLPPTFDAANNMVHNFYVLGENQVMSLVKGEEEDEDEDKDEDEDEDEDELWPDRNFKAMGSSPGWLVFLDTRTSHLFISDPILAFNMKLPPIHTLPSPQDEDAHCQVTSIALNSCPALFNKGRTRNYPATSSEEVREYNFLVVAEPSGDLFHVRRFVTVDSSGPLGYGGPRMGFYHGSPYRTLGFNIHRYDPDTGLFVYMDCSLDGLAFFVGCNNGLAIHTDQYPELKPDSIYYTAPPGWINWSYGGHDVGIFNNRDKTFSPCFYPPDVQSKKMVSGPMWFRPRKMSRRTFLVHNHDGTLTITPKLPK
ncbi:Unknown protein [Striga hermonthica]|uniref:KIB1-4 beta-propeller domain-containing protein n=1 Tax=Striga hermonthica TaxID=68872 RepID=A0A9N7MTL2_STRHE|nr:Unknown protein [Striga hermonthica]